MNNNFNLVNYNEFISGQLQYQLNSIRYEQKF